MTPPGTSIERYAQEVPTTYKAGGVRWKQYGLVQGESSLSSCTPRAVPTIMAEKPQCFPSFVIKSGTITLSEFRYPSHWIPIGIKKVKHIPVHIEIELGMIVEILAVVTANITAYPELAPLRRKELIKRRARSLHSASQSCGPPLH